MSFTLQSEKLASYYRWHSVFYDATRWAFLFGRHRLIKELPALPARPRILEVGCGTGWNLSLLSILYPDAKLTGADLSQAMLNRASKKCCNGEVKFLKGRYGIDDFNFEPYDLIILSYSVSMMGAEAENIINRTIEDLKPGGHIAVVDFHQTRFGWFRRWMNFNHVSMDGRLFSFLQNRFQSRRASVHQAYFGWWQYFTFVGRRKTSSVS